MAIINFPTMNRVGVSGPKDSSHGEQNRFMNEFDFMHKNYSLDEIIPGQGGTPLWEPGNDYLKPFWEKNATEKIGLSIPKIDLPPAQPIFPKSKNEDNNTPYYLLDDNKKFGSF